MPPRPVRRPEPDEHNGIATNVLATAIYVAGTTRLEPGNRYSIAIHGSRLWVMGPTDSDAGKVVLDRPIEAIKAGAVEGRLILSEPETRSGPVLAFMSVAGPSPSGLAEMIDRAAEAAARH